MTEDLLTKNSMDEDLLTRIQRETHERLRELRKAVDEHDRLQADLSVLDKPPEPPTDQEPIAALKAAPESARGPQAVDECRAPADQAPPAAHTYGLAEGYAADARTSPPRARTARCRAGGRRAARFLHGGADRRARHGGLRTVAVRWAAARTGNDRPGSRAAPAHEVELGREREAPAWASVGQLQAAGAVGDGAAVLAFVVGDAERAERGRQPHDRDVGGVGKAGDERHVDLDPSAERRRSLGGAGWGAGSARRPGSRRWRRAPSRSGRFRSARGRSSRVPSR